MPTNFSYWVFAIMVFVERRRRRDVLRANAAAIMNSVPAEERGGAAGIQAAFLNTGFVLSIGVFFSLMIVGLTNTLPKAMFKGLSAHGVARPRPTRSRTCRRWAACSRRSSARIR